MHDRISLGTGRPNGGRQNRSFVLSFYSNGSPVPPSPSPTRPRSRGCRPRRLLGGRRGRHVAEGDLDGAVAGQLPAELPQVVVAAGGAGEPVHLHGAVGDAVQRGAVEAEARRRLGRIGGVAREADEARRRGNGEELRRPVAGRAGLDLAVRASPADCFRSDGAPESVAVGG